ncbi:hypothetical protein MKW94_013934 [Papaver nudicaule]|uniref:rRNA 2'-O-methyltransferase fibrillarin n=1 Tax=Papaver nudicaule TaxID=74823 RepID=A0AA42AUD3_PAPNU|nr:hypothetical protein [Papaver nudicaule]
MPSRDCVECHLLQKLQQEQFKPSKQVTLKPFERDHACVVGGYRVPKKVKLAA